MLPWRRPNPPRCEHRFVYLVGIGASAGGLEALEHLLAHLPKTGRAAYVIAQHMAPDGHAELMARLLTRRSAHPVVLAQGGEELQEDHVYLLPAGGDGVVLEGRLMLQPADPAALSRPSVDVLFASLAGSTAVGIVLSGTGSDGVRGCRAIRSAGGLCLAQDPLTARHSGMPKACLDAGVAHEVLAPQAMGARLARHLGLNPPPQSAPLEEPREESTLEQLVQHLRERTGLDFSGYKPETLARRLSKRVADLGLESGEAYLAFLARRPAEWEVLAQHFLVSLSSFFRDPEAFRALERSLPGKGLRVWVPGCASGEECYTLAMLLEGRVTEVLGTDLNESALERARGGVYSEAALAELEPALRERHFVGHAVRPELRALCSFQRHDVVHGELPQTLDLISCRNLFIYLKSELQARLLARFQQALRPGGLLFLGPSETLGPAGGPLFRVLDPQHKLYSSRARPPA